MKKLLIIITLMMLLSCSNKITQPEDDSKNSNRNGKFRVCIEIEYESGGIIYTDYAYYRHVDFVSINNVTGDIVIEKYDSSVGGMVYFYHVGNLVSMEMKSEIN